MQRFPANKEQWFRAAFRVVATLLVTFTSALPVLLYVIPVVVARVEPLGDIRFRWRFEDYLTDLVVIPVFCLTLLLAIALLVLSVLSLRTNRRLSGVGFGLLLAYVLFVLIAMPAFARAREKPVIYLYPETETMVNVKLLYDGRLLYTYPKYPQGGWTVVAEPSGELIDTNTGREHYCLFWEGEDPYKYRFQRGFIVEGKDTAAFLECALSELGLSEREANEFIVYWMPRMAKNRFNLVYFATDEYNRRVPLEITPPPDTVIRVFMIFKAINAPIEVPPQELTHVERRGFTVVEWGGTELH